MSIAEFIGPAGQPSRLEAWRQAWLAIDRNERALEFVQTRIGSLLLCAVFVFVLGAGLQLSVAALALVAAALFAMILLPAHALTVLVGSSLFYFAMRPFRIDGWAGLVREKSEAFPLGGAMGLQLASVAVVLALSAMFLFWQRQFSDTTAAKRPVLTLILLWSGLLMTAILSPQGTLWHAMHWSVVGVSVSSLWILAYSAIDARGKDTTSTLHRSAFLRPFWGGSAVPIGKSFGFLNRFAAKDETELAATRLKALKLAVWALVLTGVLKLCEFTAYQQYGLADLQTAVLAHAGGNTLGGFANWASLLTNYFIDLLIIAVWGHYIVAVVRMAGYRIPRNTVNPLGARTLAEFWNRYFYYFKEMLVDLFFYPAFRRYFKGNTKLRIAFATFCAAGLGNFLYHFMRETHVFADGALLEKLWIFQSAVFYSLALATGLIVSQWRGRKVGPEDGFLAYHVWSRLNVIAFFCFLKIFDDISGEGTLTERAAFLFGLFGV